MMLNVTSAIEIPESEKNTFWVSQALNNLTRNIKSYNNPDTLETVRFYEVKNGIIKIPRLYNVKELLLSSS